jgi:hypothetical protein
MCEKTSAHPALQKMVLQAEEESPIVYFVIDVYKEEEIDRPDYRTTIKRRRDGFIIATPTMKNLLREATDAERGEMRPLLSRWTGSSRDYAGHL